MLSKRIILVAASFLPQILCGTAFATPITYLITMNTSTLKGQGGYIDLQFNPGFQVMQDAVATIADFSTDGTLDSPSVQLTGDGSGLLPNTVSIDNGTQFNDYFEGVTFGNFVSFSVAFAGPALMADLIREGCLVAGELLVREVIPNVAEEVAPLRLIYPGMSVAEMVRGHCGRNPASLIPWMKFASGLPGGPQRPVFL